MAPFPVTRHSIVGAIRSASDDVRRSAFDSLVSAYWKPVFKYVRLKWHASPDDAADLTQGFFLKAYEKDFFASFDPAKARFRTFLRTCLDGFVSNTRKAGGRLKRGGDVNFVPLDFAAADRELDQHAGNAIDDFDAYFHREWLRSLFATAVDRLRDRCAASGHQRRLAIFERYDLADDEGARPTYDDLARTLGIAKTDVTNELAAARREFRSLVLALLREQCASDEEFENERRALAGRTPLS
jgi:DNA-directed RNA polymerase specialized sigma24 family protein